LELTKDTKVVTDVSPLSFDGSRHFSLIHLIDCPLHPSSIPTPSIDRPSLYHFVRSTNDAKKSDDKANRRTGKRNRQGAENRRTVISCIDLVTEAV
jgi:hypothetical protein